MNAFSAPASPDSNLSMCILVSDLDAPTGGVQKNSRLLMKEFRERGLKTIVFTRNYEDRPSFETVDGASIHRCPVVGRSRGMNGLVYFVYSVFWLIKNRRRYDVVHCQQMFGPAMSAAIAGIFTRRPAVVRVTLSGPTGEAAAVQKLPLSRLRIWLLKKIRLWIVLTRQMSDEIAMLGIPKSKIKVIYNGTDFPEKTVREPEAKILTRNKLSLPHGKLAIFVGRLSEEKNIDTLIRAWTVVMKSVDNAHLIVLGSDSAYRGVAGSLTQLVSSLGITSNVHFLGFRSDVKSYLLASDLFVLPSAAEGMSNALVEAFSCGLPIIATDIEANKELCVDEIDSILVPVGDESALSSAICRIFDNARFANALGTNAREKAEKLLSAEKMISSYLQVYSEAVFSNNAPDQDS